MTQPKTELEEWLTYIDQQHFESIDMGLERFSQVLDAMDLRQPAPKIVTIAGTNGKGSTARLIEALLLSADYRVGTTLSPHLWRFNERIRIDGVDASDETICQAFAAIDKVRGDLPLTYFEFGALAALYCMAAAEVDVAVLEIGLGGRLDAFNALDADVAVITSIGLDHQAFLGNTREAIGGEKAGILRTGQHVVLGRDMPDSVLTRCDELRLAPRRWGYEFVSREVSQAVDAELNGPAGSEVNGELDGELGGEISVAGQWRLDSDAMESLTLKLTALAPHNIAMACEAVKPWMTLNAQQVQQCADQRVPGRMDMHKSQDRLWIGDVCHNPHGAQFFMSELAARGIKPAFFICSMLEGKDHLGFYQMIQASAEGANHGWVFVDSCGDRQMTGAALAERVGCPGAVAADMGAAMDMAIERTRESDAIVIFGSFSAVEQCPWLA